MNTENTKKIDQPPTPTGFFDTVNSLLNLLQAKTDQLAKEAEITCDILRKKNLILDEEIRERGIYSVDSQSNKRKEYRKSKFNKK